MTIEYAWCPGNCGGRVRIWGESGINYCCHNCWRWFYENGIMDSVPLDDAGKVIAEHSDACGYRQAMRAGVAVITDRQFMLMSPEQLRKLKAAEADHGSQC